MKAVQTDSYGWKWRETNFNFFFYVMSSKRQVTRYKLTFAVCRIQGDFKFYFIWKAGVDSSTFYFREGHHQVCPQDRYPIPHEGGVSNLFCYKLLEDSLSHHTEPSERRLSHFMWIFFQSSISPFPNIIYLYHLLMILKTPGPICSKVGKRYLLDKSCPVGNAIFFTNTYRLDSDLFVG